MSATDWVSIVSAIIAIIAAVTSYRSLREQKRIASISANLTMAADAEGRILSNPELLALHNIPADALEQCNATPAEVVYLLKSFTAGQALYMLDQDELADDGGDGLVLTNYRKNLLSNSKVRKVWKNILKGKLMRESAFTKAVDKFIATTEVESYTTS